MCLACEMGLWMDALSPAPPSFPSTRADEVPRFACDVPQDVKPEPPAETSDGEPKP